MCEALPPTLEDIWRIEDKFAALPLSYFVALGSQIPFKNDAKW